MRQLADGSAEVSHLALLFRCHQSRAIVPSRLDIYMAIAGTPTHQPGCAPRGQNWNHLITTADWEGYEERRGRRLARGRREKRGRRGCAQDEAAGGESVLRILEVMSRAVLYNTRSRPFQSRPPPPPLPLSAPPLTAAEQHSTSRITGILMKNGNRRTRRSSRWHRLYLSGWRIFSPGNAVSRHSMLIVYICRWKFLRN